MFDVAPLLLLALVLWLHRGLPRPPGLTAVAAFLPVALLLTLPLDSLLNLSILSDTFGLIPFWRLATRLAGGVNDVRIVLGGSARGRGRLRGPPTAHRERRSPSGPSLPSPSARATPSSARCKSSRGARWPHGRRDRSWIDDAVPAVSGPRSCSAAQPIRRPRRRSSGRRSSGTAGCRASTTWDRSGTAASRISCGGGSATGRILRRVGLAALRGGAVDPRAGGAEPRVDLDRALYRIRPPPRRRDLDGI